MTAGAIAPGPALLTNLNAQHLGTEITMKQAYRRTVFAAQLVQ